MGPLHSIDLSPREGELLLQVAWLAVKDCVLAGNDGDSMIPHAEGGLRQCRGAFVTLTLRQQLRGCIGTLEASEPLAETVADCARGAALRDPRFRPVREEELAELDLEVSVLTIPQAMRISERSDLLQQLRPRTDGLLLEHGRRRSTFLPQVWEQLPEPEVFLSQLLEKAGLPADYWSGGLRFSRYQSTSFRQSGSALDEQLN